MIRDFLATQATLPEDDRQPLGDVEEFAHTLHDIPFVQGHSISLLITLSLI